MSEKYLPSLFYLSHSAKVSFDIMKNTRGIIRYYHKDKDHLWYSPCNALTFKPREECQESRHMS